MSFLHSRHFDRGDHDRRLESRDRLAERASIPPERISLIHPLLAGRHDGVPSPHGVNCICRECRRAA